MKVHKNSPLLFAGLLLMLLLSNCKKQESPEPVGNGPQTNNPTIPPNPYVIPAVTFSAPVMGFVVDENNNPVQNALVSTGGKTFTTDVNGAFEFTAAPFTGNFCYIKATKNGYFFGSVTVQGKAGSSFSTQLVMVSQKNRQAFAAATATDVAVAGGANVSFPANAITTLDGKPYTGNVNVASTYLNPNDANFSQVTPGGDLRAYSSDGKDVMLYSYGMVGVELRDDIGNPLQLASGQKATITMPVPAGMQNAPATMPLWYFDENKGVWIEEGTATLANGKYTGTVSHFTYWNCDVPGNRAKLRGKIKDCDGDVVSNMTINTGQTLAWPAEDGSWERWVPVGVEFKINAYDNITSTKINLDIPVSALADGQDKDLGIITVPCRQKVKATITDCDNNPFNGYAIIKSGTGTFRGPVINGRLSISVKSNGEQADLYLQNASIGQLAKIQITLPVSGKSLDLGTQQACSSTTVVAKFSFDYDDGSGTQTVNFESISFGQGTYYTQMDMMIVLFENGSSNIKSASLTFKDPKVGPVNSSDDSTMISLNTDKKTFYGLNLDYNIQKYDNPGGEVSGTFSGTMMMYDYSGTPTNTQVTVSNGKFAVLRMPDEQ